MSRKDAVVVVPSFPGTRDRDKGKTFRITEWSADRAERWLDRAILAINKGGGELPLDLAGIGWEGIAIIGINAFLRGNADTETLLVLQDELLECVEIVRDPKHPTVLSKLLPGDLEEIATRKWLRAEVLSVHANFPVAVAFRELWQKIMTPRTSPDSLTPRTSPQGSQPSSEAA